MTTINNIEDFLRILREDDSVRSAVRRELLSEELLALPERIASLTKSVEELRESTNRRFDRQDEMHNELKESTDRRFDMVISRLDRQDEMHNELKESTDRRFDMVISRLDRQDEMHNELKESTDRRFDMVISRLDRQHRMIRQQHDDFGRFRGNYAIHAAQSNRLKIARSFARPRLMRRIQLNLLSIEALNDILNGGSDYLDILGFSENALDSFPEADMVIEVIDRRGQRPSFYVVVEASFTVDDGDALRAAERAEILQCATGLDTYAVVAGVKLAPNIEHIALCDAEEFIEMDNENVALWYQIVQIVEENLEPFDPC